MDFSRSAIVKPPPTPLDVCRRNLRGKAGRLPGTRQLSHVVLAHYPKDRVLRTVLSCHALVAEILLRRNHYDAKDGLRKALSIFGTIACRA